MKFATAASALVLAATGSFATAALAAVAAAALLLGTGEAAGA